MSASKEIGISEARTWTPTPEIIAKRSEALAKHFIAANDERQAMQARVAARNRKMAEALERQWANAGIDIKALEAVSLANSIEGQEEMNEYRRRKLPASPSGPDVSPYRVPRSPTGVAPAITVVQRTPPYDIAANPWLIPANPSPAFAFANDNVNGNMNFFVTSAEDAPSTVAANAAIGIVFFPPPLRFYRSYKHIYVLFSTHGGKRRVWRIW